jgi:hypothetical protein
MPTHGKSKEHLWLFERCMSEDKRIDILRNKCYDLYKFKDNPVEYEKAIIRLEQEVTKLGLNHVVDPIELSFLMLTYELTVRSGTLQFRRYVDELFKIKKTSFFFQLPELFGFPDNYQLGHGKLLNFDSLPSAIKDFAAGLTKGRVGKVRTELERVQTVYLQEISIPINPHNGCWLEISKSGISSFIMLNKALQAAEESLDILRILRPHIRIPLPQYAISKNAGDRKASFEALKIGLYKYHFDQGEQKLIARLNNLVVSSRSDLEKRVLNALHFYRIGRNFSPEDQELFYYVAAIENLVIGKDDRDVLRWKFSEKAAFLLEDDMSGRLEMATKLKNLYDSRSRIAHGSEALGETRNVLLARECLVKIIIKILELIDKRGLQSVSPLATKNSSLDEYIDQIKYSGDPKESRRRANNIDADNSV